MKKNLIVVAVIVLALGGIVWMAGGGQRGSSANVCAAGQCATDYAAAADVCLTESAAVACGGEKKTCGAGADKKCAGRKSCAVSCAEGACARSDSQSGKCCGLRAGACDAEKKGCSAEAAKSCVPGDSEPAKRNSAAECACRGKITPPEAG